VRTFSGTYRAVFAALIRRLPMALLVIAWSRRARSCAGTANRCGRGGTYLNRSGPPKIDGVTALVESGWRGRTPVCARKSAHSHWPAASWSTWARHDATVAAAGLHDLDV